ncbi:MAG: thioredoxin [Chloroflexi bacterium]|nr:thioredoxin [Chloroflexota bacterium]
MPIQTLTDSNFKSYIGDSAALVLISDGGDKLRSDFKTAFDKAADEEDGIVFGLVDPTVYDKLSERFDYQKRALLIGLYRGEVQFRRSRPWASDLPDYLSQLKEAVAADLPAEAREAVAEEAEAAPVLDKPLDITDANFEQEAILASHELPVLVDFWAEWCGPCRQVSPILEKLAGEYAGQIRVVKVDTDANPGLSQAFQIRSIPTIAVFKQGKLIFMQPGALPEPSFRELIKQAIELEIPADGNGTQTQEPRPEAMPK